MFEMPYLKSRTYPLSLMLASSFLYSAPRKASPLKVEDSRGDNYFQKPRFLRPGAGFTCLGYGCVNLTG